MIVEANNLIKSERWRQFLESTASALKISLVFSAGEAGEEITVCPSCPLCGAEAVGFSESAGPLPDGDAPSGYGPEKAGGSAVFQLRGNYRVVMRKYRCSHEKETLSFGGKVDIARDLIGNFFEILTSQWSGSSLGTELATLHQINHIVLSMFRGDNNALERVIDLILSAAVILLDAEGSWLEYDDSSSGSCGGRKLLKKGYCRPAAEKNVEVVSSVAVELNSPAVRGTLGVTKPADGDRVHSFLDFMVQECVIAFEIDNLLRLMESKLNIILGAMDSLVLLIDKRMRICYANHSAQKLLRMEIQELIGLPASIIGAPWNKFIAETASAGAARGIKDPLIVRNNFCLLDWEAYPLSGGDDLPGWLVVASDRSDYYRMQEMGEHVERIVNTSNLLNVMAHEIRNPLSAIKGLFQLLKIRTDVPETLQYLDIGLGEVKRLTLLLDDFLILGKTSVMSVEAVDFNAFLKDLLSLFVIEFSGVDFEIEPADLPELPVEIDKQQMTQVLTNIIKNSYEAMEQKGRITFSLESLDGERIRILIRDSGPGISDDIKEKMFTPYFTSKVNGTGLGLAIVQTIIQNHCGEISVYNHPEGGACFSIVLPSCQSVKKGPAAEIMLITDDDMLIMPLKRLLLPMNFRVYSKARLENIRFHIEQIRPSVIILDEGYLGGTLLEKLVKAIASDDPSVRLIILGDLPQHQPRANVHYVQKPLNYPKIVNLIRSFVGS
jgi:signal transduction histidine kinase